MSNGRVRATEEAEAIEYVDAGRGGGRVVAGGGGYTVHHFQALVLSNG